MPSYLSDTTLAGRLPWPFRVSSYLDYLFSDPNSIALRNPNGSDIHYRLRFFFHIVVYAKLSNTQLPRSQRIGAHRLTISRFAGWLVEQLLLDRIQDNRQLSSRQFTEVIFCIR